MIPRRVTGSRGALWGSRSWPAARSTRPPSTTASSPAIPRPRIPDAAPNRTANRWSATRPASSTAPTSAPPPATAVDVARRRDPVRRGERRSSSPATRHRTPPPNECGESTLGCLRTDVTTDEGICTTMIPCTEDKDCKDPVRSTCAATFLTQLYSQNTTLKANNLYCLQKNCQSGASSCSPGQSCLPLLVPAAAHAPDICVPNCDSAQNCPPNHVCFQRISGPANPAICIPGLLGFICETDINCLVGKCLSDGDPDRTAGSSSAPIACNSDADCAVYDSNQGTFACVLRGDGQSYCESPYSYRGNACRPTTTRLHARREAPSACFQTPAREVDGPRDLPAPRRGRRRARRARGSARPPSRSTRSPTRPHPRHRRSPASRASSRCPARATPTASGLNCRGIDTTTGVGYCTDLCATDSDPTDPDSDCHNDRWTGSQSFCATPANATTGLCAPLLADGQALPERQPVPVEGLPAGDGGRRDRDRRNLRGASSP